MTLLPCLCGKEVRLGAIRITVNRRQGVAHHIAHIRSDAPGEPICVSPRAFSCAAMKPYPLRDEDKEWFKLCARWNAYIEAIEKLKREEAAT